METLPNLIATTVQTAIQAVPDTVNGIAKIKEIQRTTGITKRQAKKLKRECETNELAAATFRKICEANPGYYYVQTIGNIQMSNLGQVLEYAKQEFGKDEKIPDAELDKEWLLKFLDTAGQVSDEEKQRILAKVLAGQLKKPDSISYRTLAILKTLTRKELTLFKKAVSYCFYSPDRYALLLKNNNEAMISVDDIMYLAECNLMDSSATVALNIKEEVLLFSCNKKLVLKLNPDNVDSADISCYYFTYAALELLPFLRAEGASLDEMKDFINKCKNSDVLFSLHNAYEEGGQIYYSDDDLLAENA